MSYTAQLTSTGKWWAVWVPEIERATRGRTLAEADETARDLIVLAAEEHGKQVEPEAVELHLDVQVPDGVQEHLRRAEALREQDQRTGQLSRR